MLYNKFRKYFFPFIVAGSLTFSLANAQNKDSLENKVKNDSLQTFVGELFISVSEDFKNPPKYHPFIAILKDNKVEYYNLKFENDNLNSLFNLHKVKVYGKSDSNVIYVKKIEGIKN